ncbi:MAG: hypothetical protein U1C57_00805 [Candidatus Doudnabacteria bacterium]|nr:hypothetical protein [bacterium]MDZ4243625.1 hypothetical protein [Candidatus Doudnabacteria bacterium]
MPEMQTKSRTPKPPESTQKYLNISEVKDNVLVLRDGGLRAIITVSSTNFALKSEDEQNALTGAFQGFLNSLDFPVQILIHSRILDINGYLEKLQTLASGQTNELLRIQMTEYIEYVGKLVEYASIMSKTFYIVVPYSSAPVAEGFGGRIKKILNPAAGVAGAQEDFEKAKIKLEERVNHVISELGGMGLRSIVLRTEELVELLYLSYNFDAPPLDTKSLEDMKLQR